MDVPPGTLIWRKRGVGEAQLFGEVRDSGDTILLVEGGSGGKGNVHFAGSTNKVPVLAEEGEAADCCEVILEYRMSVDVGVVSLPNAGKSQLLVRISNASPRIQEYPFSTQEPVKAVVPWEWQEPTFVELPAMCEGMNGGKGFGSRFLKHLMRARVLLHLVDGTSADPLADINTVNQELMRYDPTLIDKPQIVAVTKMDLPLVRDAIPELRRGLASYGADLYFLSAQTGEGVDRLIEGVHKRLESNPNVLEPHAETAPPVRPLPRRESASVSMDGDVFVVASVSMERLVALPDFRNFPARLQLRRELSKRGIIRALEEAGVASGDVVRIGTREFQWE